MSSAASTLVEKLESLTSEQIAEVEAFAEAVRMRGRERGLTQAAMAVSGPAFEAVWDNPEDSAYDAL
jgi:hypothetical protein